jgi:predicted nucleic acid-binding protein
MLVSYDLLYELEAVLLRPYFRDKLTYSDVLAYVSWIRDSAELYESYAYQVPRRKGEERVSADPDDDYLYYLALDTMADYLVSGDSHLLQISSRLVYVVVELGKLRLIHALTAVTSFAQAPSLRRVTTDWLYSIFEARGCLDAY